MKKIFYIFALLTVSIFVACNKDDSVKYEHTAAVDAVGTYEGTWQQISSFTGDTTYAVGKMSVALVNDTLAQVCNVTINNDSAEWKTKTSVANVAHAGKSGDIVFGNDVASNGFGSAFAGRLYGNGTAILSCAIASKMIVVIDGKKYKKNVLVVYNFTGKKVN